MTDRRRVDRIHPECRTQCQERMAVGLNVSCAGTCVWLERWGDVDDE